MQSRSPPLLLRNMIGSKYNDNDREKAMHLFAKGMTPKEVSKETGIPYGTLRDWKSALEGSDDFNKLQQDYKKRFEEQVTNCIDVGMQLIQRNFERAKKNDEILDKLVKDYVKACERDGHALSNDEIKALGKKLSALKCEDTSKLANTIGILYDKRALSQGKETSIVSVKPFEELEE